jgi:hypothetical protein
MLREILGIRNRRIRKALSVMAVLILDLIGLFAQIIWGPKEKSWKIIQGMSHTLMTLLWRIGITWLLLPLREVVAGINDAPVRGENFVFLNASVDGLQDLRDSESIELFGDHSEEVDDLQFTYDNLFEKFYGFTKLNKRFLINSKRLIVKKKNCLLISMMPRACCGALKYENAMLIARITSLKMS